MKHRDNLLAAARLRCFTQRQRTWKNPEART